MKLQQTNYEILTEVKQMNLIELIMVMKVCKEKQEKCQNTWQ